MDEFAWRSSRERSFRRGAYAAALRCQSDAAIDHEDKAVVDRQRELEEVSSIVFRCGGSALCRRDPHAKGEGHSDTQLGEAIIDYSARSQLVARCTDARRYDFSSTHDLIQPWRKHLTL